MIFFFTIYFLLSLAISFLLSLLSSRRLFKIFIFSVSFSIFSTFWFSVPGEQNLAPIFSILFLELTILEGNGIYRVLRPLVLTFLVFFTISLIFWKKKPRN